MKTNEINIRPAGYLYVLEHFGIESMPNWHASYVSLRGISKLDSISGVVEEIYPKKYWPGEKITDHLEFALKYDGVSLVLLSLIFKYISKDKLVELVKSKPTGQYARRIWFFYEFLTGEILDLNDITSGNYVEALDSNDYFTISNGIKSRRHRVINNLPGTQEFCPIIRKTNELIKLESENFRLQCEEVMKKYPERLHRRALSYLYGKETKSSFEIEQIKPNALRVEKFISCLMLAEKQDFCEKNKLIDLQNRIVDPRFACDDYRSNQNYVGQTIAFQKEMVHFISPKPEDLQNLMSGLISCNKIMKEGNISPVVHAAAIAYGFVFLHPFEDGNGRIHRFLIHNILSLSGIVPPGMVFPISAVMLKNPMDYDESLESYSRYLLRLIDYSLDNSGTMFVKNETAHLYRYMDLTVQSEYLYQFINKTINEELVEELDFLVNFDNCKKTIQNIIDMPDRLVDLFIQLCIQNSGKLSEKKRNTCFDFLSDSELREMEEAVQAEFYLADRG